MDWDAIIGLSAAPGLVIIVTVVVWLFRRRRTRRDPDQPPSAQVYRSPLMLKVTGWVLAPIGVIIGLTSVHPRGTDDDAVPIMVVSGVIILLGAALIERTGSVFWLTDNALIYKKPLRRGTIPYADIRDYRWRTSTSGSAALTGAHVTITRSNGRKTKFNISFQHTINFSPLHEWAEAHHRRDLLAPSTRLTQAPRHP